jgi:hypothetical protein
VAESGKLICGKCRSERLRLLVEILQNVLLQIDDLTRKNKVLEEQLRLATVGRECQNPHTDCRNKIPTTAGKYNLRFG